MSVDLSLEDKESMLRNALRDLIAAVEHPEWEYTEQFLKNARAALATTPNMGTLSGDKERRDLNLQMFDNHWERPDGSIYCVDSSD